MAYNDFAQNPQVVPQYQEGPAQGRLSPGQEMARRRAYEYQGPAAGGGRQMGAPGAPPAPGQEFADQLPGSPVDRGLAPRGREWNNPYRGPAPGAQMPVSAPPPLPPAPPPPGPMARPAAPPMGADMAGGQLAPPPPLPEGRPGGMTSSFRRPGGGYNPVSGMGGSPARAGGEKSRRIGGLTSQPAPLRR